VDGFIQQVADRRPASRQEDQLKMVVLTGREAPEAGKLEGGSWKEEDPKDEPEAEGGSLERSSKRTRPEVEGRSSLSEK
jgi:hypothetical protein